MDHIEETKEKAPDEEPDSTYHLNGNGLLVDGRDGSSGEKDKEEISHNDSDHNELLGSPRDNTTSKKKTSKVAPGSETLGSNKENSNGAKGVSRAQIYPKKDFERDTALPLSATPLNKSAQTHEQENLYVYKRSGTYIEYADEIEPELDRAKYLKFGVQEVVDETDEEDNVYPLSIKYDRVKACKAMLLRYFYLLILLILLIPTDIYTGNEQRKLEIRTGIYANRYWDMSFDISGVTDFNIQTKNCKVYFLEKKTGDTSKINVFVNAAFGSNVKTALSGTVRSIVAKTDDIIPNCEVEVKIPGGTTIPQLTITFNGDSITDLVVYDSKDGSVWSNPLTITSMTISVTDSYPHVILTNTHTVGTLTVTGSYCICNFNKLNIGTMSYTITVGSLSIVQNNATPINKVIYATPAGGFCAAGGSIGTTTDSNCPTTMVSTYTAQTTTCTRTMYICSSETLTACPASGTAVAAGQGSFTLTQNDGPMQFVIDSSTNATTNSYLPTVDNYAISSQNIIGEYKTDFSTNTNDPRMYLYETVSPGYARMWVHSSLGQYVQARPWLLSMLSLGILQPAFLKSTLIHVPANCPAETPMNVKTNTLISAMLSSLSYSEASHMFAMATNNTYYTFEQTARGDYIQTEVPFLGGNIFIILCLVVSILIAVYCVIAIFLILVRLKWQIEDKLDKYLERNRKFAQAKKEIQHKNDETKKKLVTTQTRKRLVKILYMGVLSTNLKTKTLDINNEDEAEILAKQSMKKKISLSFFQAPYLYIEHLRRRRANSFKMFLNSIYESPSHFPKWKLVSEHFFHSTSIRVDLLEARYLEYCTKEGLKPREIEEEDSSIKEFNLNLEYKIDTSTDAYTHIRWKTPLEKLEEIERGQGKKEGLQEEDQESIISQFLVSECSKSSFKRDFILITDLKQRYDTFCKDNRVDDLVKINIVGCPELDQFGAKLDSNLYIPYFNGITLHKLPGLKSSKYTPGIIRIPKESKARIRRIGICKKVYNYFMTFLFGSEGVITNLLIVLIHFLLLVCVPYGMLSAVTWSLLQIDNVNDNIYGKTFDVYDVFNPNTKNFWLDHLPVVTVFYVIVGLCCAFFLSGLIELISFYATGARDTGKYIVIKSWAKWFFSVTFWFLLFIFVAMYSAYFSVILLWCILGAVLNPQKFLPMAVAAIVIIGFSYLLYTRLKKINKKLTFSVGSIVDGELKNSLIETVKKELNKLSKLRHPPVEDNTKIQFNRAMNSYMSKNNYPSVTQDTTNSILDGNMGELINMMNKNCGIDENISLGLVGWLKQDSLLILDSIVKLAIELKLDVNLNTIIGEIALDSYNPDSVGINKAQGTIILSLKKLFRNAFPTFPLETLDGLLQVVSEGDPRPLESIVDKLNIPNPLFKMCIGYVTDNETMILKSLKNIAKDSFPKHYLNFFDSLYKIYKGNPKTGLKQSAENLGIPFEFLLQLIVAISKQDNSLIRYALDVSVDQIFAHLSQEGVVTMNQSSARLKDYLLSIYTMSRGSEFDIRNLAKTVIPKADSYIIELFYKASKGILKKFDTILDRAGIIQQKKVVMEFSSLLFERDTEVTEIAGRLGVYPENAEVLHAAIQLVVITSKLFIKTLPQLEKLKSIEKGEVYDERTQMTENLIVTSSKIKRYLHILFISGVLNFDMAGGSSKIMKLGSFIREIFYEITGDDEHKRQPRYKDFDYSVLREKITATSNIIIQKILKGDQSIVEKIIDTTLEFLDFKTEKKDYFKSLCFIISAFATNLPIKEIDDNLEYQISFKMTSTLLDIDEDHLEFVLDVLSGNPYRIFKCLSPNPRIDLKNYDIIADFLPSRVGMISDILSCTKRQVKKLCAIWINSYDLVHRGESNIKSLGQDALEIDPMYFYLLIKKTSALFKKTHAFNKTDYNETIRKFIDIQLQRVKLDLLRNKPRRKYFFEDLKTEREYDYGDEENPGLDSLPQDHPIMDSAFDNEGGRKNEEIIEFIDMLENILYLKEGEVKTFAKLFNVNDVTAKNISAVYKSVHNKELDSHFSLLITLSKKIEIKMGRMSNNEEPDEDFHQELQNKEEKQIEKKLSKKELNQSMFLQFFILFTITKLNVLLQNTTVEKFKMRKKLNNLFSTINKFLPDQQKLIANDISFPEVFPSLFESGFFKKISKYFFHVVAPYTTPIKRPEAIFGIITGLSLQNKNLIRNSMVKLVGGEIKLKYLNGVFGFIVNDPSLEKDMRATMKKMNLSPALGLNLVELVTDDTERDKYNAALSISKNYCTAARRVSALVALFKKDLSNIRIISERLDLDTDIISIILACATKRLDLLHENFKVLSRKLGINNTFALRTILSIGCGNVKLVDILKEKKNKYFHIEDDDLLESIMFLTSEGTKMRDEHTRFDIKDSTHACQSIYDTLKTVFGISKAKSDEFVRGAISKSFDKNRASQILSQEQSEDSLSDDSFDVRDQDFDIKDLMDVEDPLLANIKLLVDCCWNDGKSLGIVADSLANYERRNPGSLNSIWAKFPEKGVETLTKKFRGIYEGAVEQLAHMEGIISIKIKENMKFMKALENGDRIDFDVLTDDEAEVIQKLSEQDTKTAYKIGCTYNITQFRELNQQYMLCETCETTTGEDVVVCLCCAEFCHKGHKMMKGNKGRRGRVVCSCGSNIFPDCRVSDMGNPLVDIKGEQNIPETQCCLIKEDNSKKESLGKKIRDKIEGFALRKAESKKKKFQPLLDKLQAQSKALDSLRSPQVADDRRNILSPPANEDEEEDTIKRMEKEVDGLKIDDKEGQRITPVEEEKEVSLEDNKEDFEGGMDNSQSKIGTLEDGDGSESEEESFNIEEELDTEEEEEYEFLVLEYTSQLFMRDLIACLKFDKTEVKENCPKLVARNFRIFDESLQRRVHLYEHIIHLAHGFCRPGFLKIVCNNGLFTDDKLHRATKPYEPGHSRFFDACISFVSAFQGDLENFSKYCRGLLEAINLQGTTDFPAREKAIKILMLIKGDSIDAEVEGISATGDQYRSIFDTLFGKQSKSAMYLHKLGTMSEEELITLFNAKEMQGNTTHIQNYKKLGTHLIDNFLVRNLEMDTDSINWLSALTRIAMGDYDGFDYVSKEYDISNAKSGIYKAICTRDHLIMDPLFHAIDEEVPFELCKNMAWILNGDIDMLRDLILYRLHIETQDKRFKVTYDNVYKLDLPKELEEEKSDLGDYLKILFTLIEGETFDVHDLKSIIRLCGIDPEIAHLLAGFNALLNKDYIKVHEIFEFEQIKKEIDDIDLVHSVIKLGSGKWKEENILQIIREVIISQNLFTKYNINDKVNEIKNSNELKIINNILYATEGNLQSLGQVCDFIFFNNKSWICTLFSVMSEGKLSLADICEDQYRDLALKKFKRDINRVFERIFTIVCKDQKITEFIYQYNIPDLLFCMMCPSLGIVERFFSYKDSLTFLDNDIISTIVNFTSTEELVPTLYCFFKNAKPILEKKFETEVEQTSETVFPLKIENYEFAPNPMMEKMGDIYKSLNFSDNEDIIKTEKLGIYKTDYDYDITKDGVIINAPKLFKLMFLAGYQDNSAMFTLMKLLTPLFRNITGGIPILKIAIVLAKSKKEKIFDHMANLVRLIIIGMITEKIELKSKFAEEEADVHLTDEDIRKFSETFNFTDNLVNGIVNWIRGALILLDKNSSNISINKYKEVFYGMCDSLYEYEQEIQRGDVLVHDIEKQTDLMITIVGLCKGNYRKVEVVGVQVGCFENTKVRELMNILNKYKSIMFRNNVFGLPHFAIGSRVSGAMGDAKGAMGKAWDETKAGARAAGRAVGAGARAAVNGIGNGISNGLDAAGNAINSINPDHINIGSMPNMPGMPSIPGYSMGGVTMPGWPNMPGLRKAKIPSLGKMPKLMPNLSSLDPDKLAFGDIFKQFDKDRSGYIDFNEFCELTKYMGLFLDKEESLKLFSMSDRNSNNQIDLREFKYAMALLKLRVAYESLRKIGLTIEDLVWYGILGMIFLSLVLIFIFLGIGAFSKAEGFNAVINSLLPLTAGAAAAARNIDLNGSIEKIKDFVQKIILRLKSR